MSINLLFLDVLNSAINNHGFDAKSPVSSSEYVELFNLAEKHKLLPLVFDKLYDTYPYDKNELDEVKRRVKFLLYRQVIKTEQIMSLYQDFTANNIHPLIFKGVVCKSLYPKPDLRISSDEDILVSDDDFEICTKVLQDNGFFPDESVNECENHLTFRNAELITIELHKKLFVRDDDYFESYNDLFKDVFEDGVFIKVNDVDIKTLNYTENLLYLILHSLKHFIGRGVGVRQFCDIVLFAEKYASDIDWNKLYTGCKSVNADYYTAAIFKIGKKYLGKEIDCFQNNEYWSKIEVDEKPLLEDVLSGGVYGCVSDSQNLSGVFSFSMMKNSNNGIVKTIFCSSKNLNKKYSYAKKYPVLLPIAWIHRFFFLMTGKEHHKAGVVFKSMKAGKKRSKLFDTYKIKSNMP